MKKQTPSFIGYSVTQDGRVFSSRRRRGMGQGKGSRVMIDPTFSKELNPYRGHGDYFYVSIATEKGQRSIPVHVLLADAFIGPRPIGKEIRHLDGNPHNNDLSNLVYGTVSANASDRVAHGNNRGEKHGMSKLDRRKVLQIRFMHQDGESIAVLARRFGVSESTVRDVVKRRTWAHVRSDDDVHERSFLAHIRLAAEEVDLVSLTTEERSEVLSICQAISEAMI